MIIGDEFPPNAIFSLFVRFYMQCQSARHCGTHHEYFFSVGPYALWPILRENTNIHTLKKTWMCILEIPIYTVKHSAFRQKIQKNTKAQKHTHKKKTNLAPAYRYMAYIKLLNCLTPPPPPNPSVKGWTFSFKTLHVVCKYSVCSIFFQRYCMWYADTGNKGPWNC